MRQRLKQTDEESWYESSETNYLKPDWFSRHLPTFSYMCTTNVTTVSIKGPPQLNFSSSCRVAKESENSTQNTRPNKTRLKTGQDKKNEEKLELETVE